MNLYPTLLEPAYKDYIWGGSRIPERFGRALPAGIYAESWELSDRPEGMSTVMGGALGGVALSDLVAQFGQTLMGSGVCSAQFPLLVKLIDARERLSIQVHPDDEAARQGLGEAKTEAWHILDAPPGGLVYAGLKAGMDAAAFRTAIRENRLEQCLNAIPVATGDTIFIPGGRVHAIGEGLLILEVQQNSNTTFRVYDWGRVGKDGKPRDLHVDQALQVIRWKDEAPVKVLPGPSTERPGVKITNLVSCPYFQLERIEFADKFTVRHDGSTFHALFTMDARLEIRTDSSTVQVPQGRTCLIPAALKAYTLAPLKGNDRVLRISIPSGTKPS
jgi:mannose-6-phosphate isomerase